MRATPRSPREWDQGDIMAVQAQDTVPETQLADERRTGTCQSARFRHWARPGLGLTRGGTSLHRELQNWFSILKNEGLGPSFCSSSL